MSKPSIICAALCLCVASGAFAESSLPAKPALSAKPLPLAKTTPRASGANPCAAYGPGFARINGTDTCMKVGGAASVEAGSDFRR
jgi:hypothetical protein